MPSKKLNWILLKQKRKAKTVITINPDDVSRNPNIKLAAITTRNQ